MSHEGRSVVFGRDAATYDAFRPTYPEAAIDYVESLVDARDAVEVGAGTGKATERFVREGMSLTCIEPSPKMADTLLAKGLPGVEVVVSTFEDWDGAPGSADLMYAAQSWHWINRDTGYDKALSVLRPGGVLALLWNIPLDRYDRHDEAYQRFAPQLLDDRDERIRRRDSHDWCQDMDRVGFVDTHRFTHRWSTELSSAEYRSLYSTYSDHISLQESARTRLLDALAEDVERWGGHALVEYRTEVFCGRKPDTVRQ